MIRWTNLCPDKSLSCLNLKYILLSQMNPIQGCENIRTVGISRRLCGLSELGFSDVSRWWSANNPSKKRTGQKKCQKNWAQKRPRVCLSWDSQTSLDGGGPTIRASPLRPPRTILGLLSGSSWANPHPSPDKNLLQKRAFWDHSLKLLTCRPFPGHKTLISKSDIKCIVKHT